MLATVALALALVHASDDAAAAIDPPTAETNASCADVAAAPDEATALDDRALARDWLARGQCLAAAGELAKAQRAYAIALRIDRDAIAVDDDAFRAARAALPAAHASFTARAAAVADDAIEVELVADDLLLARAAVLLRGRDEIARVPLDASHPRHTISGLDRAAAGDVTAVVLDKHDRALVKVAVPARIEKVFTPAPESAAGVAPTLLTTLGATAIGAGIVGVVVSGIALASLGPSALDEGQGWLIGVGASTGVFLAGAGLVVVDQGFGG